MPFPTLRELPDLGIETTSPVSPALAGRFFTTELPGKQYIPSNKFILGKLLFIQSCMTLCNPMDRGAWWATVHEVMKELDTTE